MAEFFGLGDREVCAANIPGVDLGPSPTPQPFTVSNVVSDMQQESYMGGGTACIGVGPAVQTANVLYVGYQIFRYLGGPILAGYLFSCIGMFFVGKLRRNKKNNPVKGKK